MTCQPEEGVAKDCPCAKKRLISSSLANSARIVVFPKTHLQRNNKRETEFEYLLLQNIYNENISNQGKHKFRESINIQCTVVILLIKVFRHRRS